MGRRRGHRPLPRRIFAGLAAAVAMLLLPALVLAHPLGNFTINHYAGVVVTPDRITLDVVIDSAEIPAFQARRAMDTDGEGEVSQPEADAGRVRACADLAPALDLRIAGTRQELAVGRSRLTFPAGVGGLSTMRLECAFAADLTGQLTAGTSISFADGSFAERIGWREIVVGGDEVDLAPAGDAPLRTIGVSERLTDYPAALLTRPLADHSIAFTASPAAGAVSATQPPVRPAVGAAPAAAASVPGGVIPGELPSIFRSTDLTPLVLLASLVTAGVLGAGHALTPGHGKTLMAAYLVGTRGTPLHAVALGLSVTVSHTLGILILAAVVVGAQGILAPDLVVRTAPVVAAVSIVAIGGWMLFGELRRRRAAAADRRTHDHDHVDHDHPHPYEHDHEHLHEQPHDHGAEHSHGGISHSHVPAARTTITWRGLFALGLAGGLIPSTSALLILLGSIAAGRPAFGFVLVVAFGFGMAVVMGGIGLALVLARGRFDRLDARSPVGRAGALVPLAAAVLVFGLGCYLTLQAVGGAPTL